MVHRHYLTYVERNLKTAVNSKRRAAVSALGCRRAPVKGAGFYRIQSAPGNEVDLQRGGLLIGIT